MLRITNTVWKTYSVLLIKSARHAILISSQNENLAVDVRGEISVSQVQ